MGIDIYALWEDQLRDEQLLQENKWLSDLGGDVGYLREAYHGEPYATRHLLPEVFASDGTAHIPAQKLRDRLPKTLRLAEFRERHIYDAQPQEIEPVLKSYIAFVALCEFVELKTGRPVQIIAWW